MIDTLFVGDNFIDKDEYTTVYTGYGLSRDQCYKAFDQFDCVSRLAVPSLPRLVRNGVIHDDITKSLVKLMQC